MAYITPTGYSCHYCRNESELMQCTKQLCKQLVLQKLPLQSILSIYVDGRLETQVTISYCDRMSVIYMYSSFEELDQPSQFNTDQLIAFSYPFYYLTSCVKDQIHEQYGCIISIDPLSGFGPSRTSLHTELSKHSFHYKEMVNESYLYKCIKSVFKEFSHRMTYKFSIDPVITL